MIALLLARAWLARRRRVVVVGPGPSPMPPVSADGMSLDYGAASRR